MTIIDVCNMALSALGHDKRLTALTDSGKEASLCSLWYDSARRSVLAAADWTGIFRQTLQVAGTPDSATGLYAYHCRFSESALRLKAKTPQGIEADIKTSGPTVYSSRPELAFSYVENSEDPDEWPQGVSDAVLCELAARIALPLTGQRTLASDAAQKARDALSKAKADNANLTRRHGHENRYAAARRGEECD